ncbi:hypothetical protein RvY_03941-2 [Ramazzottius varieornatus]|uniref:Peptidase C1A papain C-terminal domain-containing protein n=1 Tax=Ramazzottius varieornatus TaxID=947166 RepID=A0A1D1UVH2_RAMVA|nr:hypothetical protein RvY_03941-2 [Ramazzottius varieornatus]
MDVLRNLHLLLYVVFGITFIECSIARRAPPGGAVMLADKEIEAHPKLRPNPKNSRASAPLAFDSREAWPNCTSIKRIRDQGQCRTCWAVNAAGVLTDRICIASGQAINPIISAHQAASCTYTSQNADENCEAGGNAAHAYKHAMLYGLPTGGEFKSHLGCVPYIVDPFSVAPLTCSTKCTNREYSIPLEKDKIIIDGYWINHIKEEYIMSQRDIDAAVTQIQHDIMLNGPLTVTVDLYSDLATWNASQGIYKKPTASAEYQKGHIVTIIGWNRTEDGEPYWLVRNSWDPSNPNWMYNFDGDAFNIGTMVSGYFASVNAMLNQDGTRMVVFGKNADGESIAGIVNYPTAFARKFTWLIPPGPTKHILRCEQQQHN